MADVVAFGECMVEVGLTGRARAALAYGGDTFNTAVYFSRLGWRAAYATALGEGDPFSAGILRLMAEEGMDAALVRRVPGRLPGLYAFDRDASGERRFYYWRGESPAREYFALADLARVRAAVEAARLVYVSGVSQAIVGASGRATLREVLDAARTAGTAVAYDPNHRPQLWASVAEARAACDAIVPLCRHVSASATDLEGLYGPTWRNAPAAWAALGVEVVLREPSRAVTVLCGQERAEIPPGPAARAVDTTGAGDAFNAAYLSERLRGADPRAAVASARALADTVVQHAGAIVRRTLMPRLPER